MDKQMHEISIASGYQLVVQKCFKEKHCDTILHGMVSLISAHGVIFLYEAFQEI